MLGAPGFALVSTWYPARAIEQFAITIRAGNMARRSVSA